MLGSRARRFSDWVMLTAEMSSLIPLRFWMSLARSGAPIAQPQAPPSVSPATSAKRAPKRARVMNLLRSDRQGICYRKCNNNQQCRDQQHITHDAGFAALADLVGAEDDALIHDPSLDVAQAAPCGLPHAGNGAPPGFDPPRLDGRRPPAHIPLMTRTTHRAGDRRISLPGPARARAVLIRRQPAEDLSDVVALVRCPA